MLHLSNLRFLRPVLAVLAISVAAFASAQAGSGGIRTWGSVGLSETASSRAPIVQTAAGQGHVLALRADGTVVAWGLNRDKQCNIPQDLTNVVQVAAGSYFSVALLSTGKVVAWGNNRSTQTFVPSTLKDVIQIAAGGEHVLALKSDGTVSAWGWNSEGQCNVPLGLKKVVQVSAGNVHSVALQADGSVVAWGGNTYNQSNPPSTLANITQLAAGYAHTLALRKDGTVAAWGYNLYGQCTLPLNLKEVTQVTAGDSHSVARRKDGTVVAWGYNSQGQLNIPAGLKGITKIESGAANTLAIGNDGSVIGWGANDSGQSTIPRIFDGATQLAAGSRHLLALNQNGTVNAWGGNDSGQCNVPGDLSGVSQISAGFGHSLALLAKGTVVAWGQNDGGQCDVPSDLKDVTQVSAGALHSLALKSDGTVAAWGYNGNGQCKIPAKATKVTQVAAGGYHSLALLKDQTVIGWGSNQNGELNIPSTLKDVTQISSRYFHNLALKKDGLVSSWGSNSQGQTNVPAPLKNVTQVDAGAYHSVALKSDGTVSSWSTDANGESSVPAGLAGIAQVVAGEGFSAALPAVSLGVNSWQTSPGTITNATLTLATTATKDTDVAIESSSLQVTVPTMVTVLKGERTATFKVSMDSAFVGTALLKAKYQGAEAKATVTVTGIESLTLSPSTLKGGETSTATVTLNGAAPAGGVIVGLATSNVVASIPSKVVIAEGQRTATFVVTTKSTDVDLDVNIVATYGVGSKTALLKVQAPQFVSISVNPFEVKGGNKTSVTLALDAPAPKGGIVFNLLGDQSITVPTTATIAEGKTTVRFEAQTTVVATDQLATVTAKYASFSRSAKVKILAPVLTDFTLSALRVKGGGSVTGTVTLSANAPKGGIKVVLSSDSAVVSVPLSVTVSEGNTSATFLATTSRVGTLTTSAVTATLGGVAKVQSLEITAPSLTGFSLSPSSVRAGEPATGTVTISDPAPAAGLPIELASDNDAVLVPRVVVVPAGRTKGEVQILTTGVSDVLQTKVTASLAGIALSANLTVNPPVLTGFTLEPDTVKGDDQAVGTVTIATPAPAGGTVVTLNSNGIAASVPFSIGIAQGQTSASFAINTNAVAANTTVTLLAKLGTVTKTANLSVVAARVVSLGLTDSKVTGGKSTTGVVVLDGPAPKGGFQISLSSSNSYAQVPTTITVPAGSYLANFAVTTKSVATTTRAIVTAKLGTSSASATLQVLR